MLFWPKVIIFNFILLFLLSEVTLQVFPHLVPQSNYHKIYRVLEPNDWRLKPNLNQNYYGGCYHTKIKTNPLGFRIDKKIERPLILALGDSFVLGLEVDNENHFTHILNKKIPFDVLNLGHGGAGPADYKRHLEDFLNNIHKNEMDNSPFITSALVFFYLGNDFENLIGKSRHGLKRELMTNIKKKDPRRIIPKSWRVVKTLYALEVFYRRFVLTAFFKQKKGQVIDTALYFQKLEKSSYWPKIESKLNQVFLGLKELQKEHSIKISIVPLPGVLEFTEGPKGRRVSRQNQILKMTSLKYGLHFIPLAQSLNERVAREALPFPYLSYPCDGHYSPLGHQWMADFLQKELLTN